MGIDLRWEEEPGCRLIEELRDDGSLVAQFLAESRLLDLPYLRWIDHRSHTVFHQQHIRQLIAELEKLSEQQHEPAVARHLQAVLELVREARGRSGSYIRFYGH